MRSTLESTVHVPGSGVGQHLPSNQRHEDQETLWYRGEIILDDCIVEKQEGLVICSVGQLVGHIDQVIEVFGLLEEPFDLKYKEKKIRYTKQNQNIKI